MFLVYKDKQKIMYKINIHNNLIGALDEKIARDLIGKKPQSQINLLNIN